MAGSVPRYLLNRHRFVLHRVNGQSHSGNSHLIKDPIEVSHAEAGRLHKDGAKLCHYCHWPKGWDTP